jgi:hypothetical protein
MVTRVHDATLNAGRKLGGPFNWRNRANFSFFQAPPASTLLRNGARALLTTAAPTVAPIEGSEK